MKTSLWNLRAGHPDLKENVGDAIAGIPFPYSSESTSVNRDATSPSLKDQAQGNSPVPLHPGTTQ
jgi:hypothetical protein